jgi:hypothetical protein
MVEGGAEATQEVSGERDDESNVIEPLNGGLKVLHPNLRACKELLDVIGPCNVLVFRKGNEEMLGVELPAQDGL